MITEDRIEHIKEWIADYALNIEKQPISLVVGISGGIDSAVTSTLCARTNLNTIVVSMPIKQNKNQHSLSIQHGEWLKYKFKNIVSFTINLDSTFNSFQKAMKEFKSDLAYANSRSKQIKTEFQFAGLI